jgi:hypothetical protein
MSVDPQSYGGTEFGPKESGMPEETNESSEAPKLGSPSIANFEAGPGVPPNKRTIH